MHKNIWKTACIDERRLKKHGQHPLWNHKIFWGSLFKRVFENRSLIKNKSFWVLPFDRKRQRLLKLFAKSFTKNLYNSSVLSSLTFQAVSQKLFHNIDFQKNPHPGTWPVFRTIPPIKGVAFPEIKATPGNLCHILVTGRPAKTPSGIGIAVNRWWWGWRRRIGIIRIGRGIPVDRVRIGIAIIAIG